MQCALTVLGLCIGHHLALSVHLLLLVCEEKPSTQSDFAGDRLNNSVLKSVICLVQALSSQL